MDLLQPTDAFQARVFEGRALAESGDFAASEETFRALLMEAHSGHRGNYASAVASLITLYGRAGRYFEAHLLARKLADLAERSEPPALAWLAFAQGKICGALGKLHLVEPLGEALAALRSTLDVVDPPLPHLEFEYHSASATHASVQGDISRARTHLNAYRDLLSQAPEAERVYRWALEISEARLALLEDRPQVALDLWTALRSSERMPTYHHLNEVALGVAVHAALGQLDEVQAQGAKAVAILESVQNEPFLVSDRILRGADLARDLERLGAADLATRVYDLVAAAVFVRLGQLDACMRELSTMGLADPDSTAELSGFRKQFLIDQEALLKRVAATLESRGAEYVRSVLKLSDASDLIAICAWCECVRPPDGQWLPIGHFVPRDTTLRVTHGICPPCAERCYAESE